MKRLTNLCLSLLLLMASYGSPSAKAHFLPQAAPVTLVDRIGGASLAVAVQGNYAFVGQSAEFTVLDISDPTQPRRIAYLPLAANDIALQGEYAYVTNKAGLAVINLADPTHPLQVGFLATPNPLNALAVADGVLYASAARAGLYIIDIAQPQQPAQVGFLPLLQIADIAVQGDYAYLATAAGLQVIKVADARHPLPVAAHDGPSNAEAVVVVGDTAYLTTAEGSLVVFDIADPRQPTLVSDLSIPTFTKNLQVNGEVAYIANGNQGIAIVDVRNRQQPRLLGVRKIGSLVTALAIVGNSLFATDISDGGLYIIDIKHPAQMIEIGVYRTPGIALDVAVDGHYAYLATGLEGDITIVDHATFPNLPGSNLPGSCLGGCVEHRANGLQSVAFYRTPDKTTKVTVGDDRLYTYGDYRSLQVFDRTNPTQLVDLGSIQLPKRVHSIVAQAALTFAGDGTDTVQILDASQAGLPTTAGLFSARGEIEDLALAGDALLVAAGTQGLLIINSGQVVQPALFTAVAIPGYAQSVAATAYHGYVLTRAGMLYVVDLHKSAMIQVVGQLRLGAKARTIAVQDEVAYLAAGEAGVYVVDLAQPTRPSLMAVYDTPGVAQNVAVIDNKIFVADGYTGLLVLATEKIMHKEIKQNE